MNKVCVVPIFGDYDKLKEPTFISDGWKYICISDKHHKSKVWKTKIFKNKELTNKQKSGYVLTQIHKLIDYDICVIVGGQIQINNDLNNFVFKEDFITLDHPSRNCIYKEAQACILLDKDDPKVIAKHMYRYLSEGFPVNMGMIQTGVTIRRRTKEVNKVCDDWWNEILNGSQRDQLSFNYVAFKNNFNYKTISSKLLYNEFKINKHN